MAKRFMLYMRTLPKREDGFTVMAIEEDVRKSMWPDGCIYFSVHEKSVKWCVEINGIVSEAIRLDKLTTFDEEFMRAIVSTTLERIKNKKIYISMSSSTMTKICSEAVSIVKEIREKR